MRVGIIGLSVGLAAVSVRADDVFTPEDVIRIRSVGGARISPDGRWIAYTLRAPRRPVKDEDGSAWSELHVVDLNGSSRAFVTGKVSVGGVQWTPDGGGISFTAKRGKDKHAALYVIPVDGGEARQVLTHASGVGGYSWHPDGKQVAFLATDKKPKDKKELEKKGFKAVVYEEDWRPVKVWLAEPNVDKPDQKARALDLPGSARSVKFAPDGRRLIVTLSPTSLIDDGYMNTKYHVIDVDSGESATQIDTPGKIGAIEWSPDGKRLAFIAAADRNDPSPGRLMVVSASGGQCRDLLPGYLGQISSIAWQDDRTIMYLGDEGVQTALGKVTIDGENKTLLPAEKHVLAGLTLSRDGQ
ncbi:MAG: S9 family peptidase, partial [Phycisphaerae bacterium]